MLKVSIPWTVVAELYHLQMPGYLVLDHVEGEHLDVDDVAGCTDMAGDVKDQLAGGLHQVAQLLKGEIGIKIML